MHDKTEGIVECSFDIDHTNKHNARKQENALKEAAETHMTTKIQERRPFDISETTKDLLEEQTRRIREGHTDAELKHIRKEIKISARKYKRQLLANNVLSDLDIRIQFMGLRNLRRPLTAVPLGMKDKDGRRIPFIYEHRKQRNVLGQNIWREPTKK